MKKDYITWHIFDREGATYFQEMLKVFVGIFMSFSSKLVILYHVDQCRLELKAAFPTAIVGPVQLLSGVGAEYSR
jgi:hypothetical protein